MESITGAESLLEKFWRRVDGDGDGQAKKASAYKLGEELSDLTSGSWPDFPACMATHNLNSG